MTTTYTSSDMLGTIERHNGWVLENARLWSERGSCVRVQVQAGDKPCNACRHAAGTYTLPALPAVPNPNCEREGGCNCVYHLILLA